MICNLKVFFIFYWFLPIFLVTPLLDVCKFSCGGVCACDKFVERGLPLGLVGPIGRGYVFVCGLPLPLVCIPMSNCWCGSPVCALMLRVATPSCCWIPECLPLNISWLTGDKWFGSIPWFLKFVATKFLCSVFNAGILLAGVRTLLNC